MREQLITLGLDFHRVEAVRGLDLPDDLRPRFLDSVGKPHSNLKPGEIGVYASHMVVMQNLLKSDAPYCIGMEDDLRLSARLPDFLRRVDELPADWDIVRLSNPTKSAWLSIGRINGVGDIARYLRVPNNMGCYLVSRRGAEKILSRSTQVLHAIDEDLRRPWDYDLVTYGILPPPVQANVLAESSIDKIGARPLGRETFLEKLKRRRRPGPIKLLKRIYWQAKTFGPIPWIRCLQRAGFHKLTRSEASTERLRVEARPQ